MKLIKIILVLLISFNMPFKVISDNNFKNILKEGGKLIFIRHAYAPGSGDPEGFDILNCSTQRNLNFEGIEQSKRIGRLFKDNKIMIDIRPKISFFTAGSSSIYKNNIGNTLTLGHFYDYFIKRLGKRSKGKKLKRPHHQAYR